MAREMVPIQRPVVGDRVKVSYPLDSQDFGRYYVVVDEDACHFYLVPELDPDRKPVRVSLRNAYIPRRDND